ncbi:regulator of G-protein signaling loco-like [Ctenocephalides felis]|uniref:regulator of G-protein signaling loco-like n=1 Tax=Ctenocephalides felis TaxID=7515 RepID=UPI000E6E1DBA|nr:regulator of G-protein signaling loco-like [Ctenocephalides felis]
MLTASSCYLRIPPVIQIQPFQEFLKKEFSHENIYFWTACERYRRLERQADREREAREIFDAHLADGALEPVNVDAQARQSTQDGLATADKDLFSQAQKQIFNLMKFDSYPRFLRSDLHRQCVTAEASHKRLPFPIDNKTDEKLRISSAQQTPSKLKKSLSNAEDRRRKSLMPWHRKTRCKSKDRGEQDYKGGQGSALAKQSALSASNAEVHSSVGSLASWDAALNKQLESPFDDTQIPDAMPKRCTLCRVVLSDESTALLQTQPNDSVRQLIDRLLEKRGIRYRAYEVHISGTNKPINVIDSSRILAGKVVVVEQRVVFKLDLPNKKVISVKSKITKTLGEVLRPILHKYNYKLDLVQVFLKAEATESLDMSKSVLVADGQRLLVQCRPEGWIGEVTQISTAGILGSSAARLKLEMSMNTKPQETFAEGASLNEITNRVFEELLQGKSEAQNLKVKSLDQHSIKSEDCGSETSSGIFSRFLRRDSNMPSKMANGLSKKYNQFTSKTNKVPLPEEQATESRKPLIAKWKPGAKLQVTGRQSESDELLEGLNRAQRARLEDQRGTEINFELPDFLKDGDNLQSCSKLRKILNTDNDGAESNVTSADNADTSKCKNPNDVPTPSIRLSPGHKPNPAPRLSIGRVQNLPSKLEDRRTSESQVQIKINALEKCSSAGHISSSSFMLNNNFPRSPVKSANNPDKSFVYADNKSKNHFEDQKMIKDYVNQNQISTNEGFANDILNCSFQSNSSSDSDKLKSASDPPPLPPKPKVLPMKPSNWGQNLQTISSEGQLKTPQERLRSSNTENILKRAIYLDQHNSSFV